MEQKKLRDPMTVRMRKIVKNIVNRKKKPGKNKCDWIIFIY